MDAEIARELENAIDVEPSAGFKGSSASASEEAHTEGLTVGTTAEEALSEAQDEPADDLRLWSRSAQRETASASLDLDALSEDEVRLSDPALASELGAESLAPDTEDLTESESPTVVERVHEGQDASVETQPTVGARSRCWFIPVLILLALIQCLYLSLA